MKNLVYKVLSGYKENYAVEWRYGGYFFKIKYIRYCVLKENVFYV